MSPFVRPSLDKLATPIMPCSKKNCAVFSQYFSLLLTDFDIFFYDSVLKHKYCTGEGVDWG